MIDDAPVIFRLLRRRWSLKAYAGTFPAASIDRRMTIYWPAAGRDRFLIADVQTRQLSTEQQCKSDAALGVISGSGRGSALLTATA